MRKQPSGTHKKTALTPAKAHERAVKAWRTKHLKYRYGGWLHGMQKKMSDGEDEAGRYERPYDHPDSDEASLGSEETRPSESAKAAEDTTLEDRIIEATRVERTWGDTSKLRQQRNAENRLKRDAMAARRRGEAGLIGLSEPELKAHRENALKIAAQLGRDEPLSGDTLTVGERKYVRGSGDSLNYFVAADDPSKRIYSPQGKPERGYILTERQWYDLHGRRGMEPADYDKYIVVVPSETRLQNTDTIDWAVKKKEKVEKELKDVKEGPPHRWGDKTAPLREEVDKQKARRAEKGYWRAQHQEVKEQAVHKRNNYEKGEVQRNYGLWNDSGDLDRHHTSKKGDGDVGLAPLHEKVYHTNQWELINEDHASRYKPDKLEFTIKAMPGTKERKLVDESGQVVTQSQLDSSGSDVEAMIEDGRLNIVDEGQESLKGFLSEHGLSGADINPIEHKDGTHTYQVTTAQGNRINPDHAERIAYELDEKFGLVRDKGEIAFRREGAAMRRKRYVAGVHDEVPSWVDVDGTPVDRTYGKRLSTTLGQRDEFGDLKKGEKDAISVRTRLPGQKQDQRLYWNLQERSDAIGFGADWRPGEKEVNDVVLAGARYKDQEKLAEAYHAMLRTDDPTEMDKYVRERFPDADDEEVKHIRAELVDVGVAGAASAAYTARRTAKNQGLYAMSEKLDKKDRLQLRRLHILPTIEHAYVRPVGQKLDRAIWRVRHPTRDPLRTHVSPLNWNITPELPSLRYRTRFTTHSPAEQKERRLTAQTKEVAAARHSIREAIETDPTTLPKLKRMHRLAVLRTSEGVMQKSQKLDFDTRWQQIKDTSWNLHNIDPSVDEPTLKVLRNEPTMRAVLETQEDPEDVRRINKSTSDIQRQLEYTQAENAKNAEKAKAGLRTETFISRYRLSRSREKSLKYQLGVAEKAKPATKATYRVEDTALTKRVKGPNGRMLKAAGKGGLYGIGAIAVAAGGVYLYDKHKEHQIEKGDQPKEKKQIPETVTIPRPEIYAAKTKKLPHNIWTDALDIENKTVPLLPSIRNNPKTIRLRNFKDISGEGYKAAPLVGNIRGAGVKNDGSWVNSVAYQQREEGAGKYMQTAATAKNRYEVEAKGKKLPVYVQIGDKERWKDQPKKDKLTTKNPNKLTADDRELIAMAIIAGDNKLRYEFGDDEKIMDLVNNEHERDKVVRKIDYVYTEPGKPVQYEAVKDEYGNWTYEPTATSRAGGKPIKTGAFFMSPGQVQSTQREYHEEAQRQKDLFEGVVGNTRVETRAGTFNTSGEKRRTEKGSLEMGTDKLPGQQAERRRKKEDKSRAKRNPENDF